MKFEVINSENLLKTEFINYPYKLGLVTEVIYEDKKDILIREYPEDNFKPVSNSKSSDKIYTMDFRPSLILGSKVLHNPETYSRLWLKLLKELTSDSYRDIISQITKIDVSNLELEINFWKYKPNSTLSVHTDKRKKIVTHLIYCNDYWEEKWGGNFCIHNNDHNKTIYKKILPVIHQSLILITSENSWHSVEPVIDQSEIERKSLQIVFWES